jgi:hypothetical protein
VDPDANTSIFLEKDINPATAAVPVQYDMLVGCDEVQSKVLSELVQHDVLDMISLSEPGYIKIFRLPTVWQSAARSSIINASTPFRHGEGKQLRYKFWANFEHKYVVAVKDLRIAASFRKRPDCFLHTEKRLVSWGIFLAVFRALNAGQTSLPGTYRSSPP